MLHCAPQIFLYGNSLRSYILAVVVPSQGAPTPPFVQTSTCNAVLCHCLAGSARWSIIQPSMQVVKRAWGAEALALGDEAEVKRRIRTELDDVARKRAVQGYEIPRDFIIDCEPFSKANHLLTDSGKPATGRLRATCAPR